MSQDKKGLLQNVSRDMERLSDRLPLVKSPQDIVPAEGNPDADIMFIGEAAGYHELKQRRPFVGAAGQLLTQTLAGHQIARESVWISNIVKARPPGNRDPKPEEIEAYRPFLDREIMIVKPRVICTLGRFSMAKFLGPDVRISQVHGQARWAAFPTPDDPAYRVVVFPMFHPAAALRSTAVNTMFIQDFTKLLALLTRLNAPRDRIETRIPQPPSNEQLRLIQ